ncbi:MAG TPA: glycosyltransferase family 39 protein, partial [Solirubrobacteraceae bacterium]|nr:glycosyltransferase family 39 protein [Solirubrobacteraceae bacterium]
MTRPRLAVQALVLAVAAGLSASTILQGVGPHDEGLMLSWANRIAGGQWPYRDFWCNYAPGQPLVLAGLVKLFGPSLLSWRVLRSAIDAVTALLAYRLARRDAGEPVALLAALAVAGAMAFPTGPGPTPPALLLALGALLAA